MGLVHEPQPHIVDTSRRPFLRCRAWETARLLDCDGCSRRGNLSQGRRSRVYHRRTDSRISRAEKTLVGNEHGASVSWMENTVNDIWTDENGVKYRLVNPEIVSYAQKPVKIKGRLVEQTNISYTVVTAQLIVKK